MTEAQIREQIEAKVARRAYLWRALQVGFLPELREELTEVDATLKHLWETLRWQRAGARGPVNIQRANTMERRLLERVFS